MRIFKTKWLAKFARGEKIADASLIEAVERAERGIIEPDDLRDLRATGADLLAASDDGLNHMLEEDVLKEITP